ncbi:MAG: hypothetical protein KME32_00990 [Mojavia pulchra JT2-VF2]|jgi:hypothetical protein|uniref:Uncharacterized protein n=1 Tax=Mojavia pulchra JT2-VF2 TaxID=287848 RepID=A0A951PVE3_9NOST|nr:hypothetical protein [Mojavia pulchra JT2-VF2]
MVETLNELQITTLLVAETQLQVYQLSRYVAIFCKAVEKLIIKQKIE